MHTALLGCTAALICIVLLHFILKKKLVSFSGCQRTGEMTHAIPGSGLTAVPAHSSSICRRWSLLAPSSTQTSGRTSSEGQSPRRWWVNAVGL